MNHYFLRPFAIFCVWTILNIARQIIIGRDPLSLESNLAAIAFLLSSIVVGSIQLRRRAMFTWTRTALSILGIAVVMIFCISGVTRMM